MTAFLFGDIVFILAWIVLYIFFPKTRKLQLFGSLLLVPFGFLDYFFRPDYWNPPLLISAIEPFSAETLIYCFGAGGIAAVVGEKIAGLTGGGKIKVKNLLIVLICGFGLFAFFNSMTELNAMNCLNFSFLVIFLVVGIRNTKFIARSLCSGAVLAIFTIIAINLGLIFFNDFVSNYWNIGANWPLFLNTSLEEILFAGVLGALWSLLPSIILED